MAAGRRVSGSTCSTDAEDRLPIRSSEPQVSDKRLRVEVQSLLHRLDDLRAAGMAHPPADLVRRDRGP